jgi:hypothetical protein
VPPSSKATSGSAQACMQVRAIVLTAIRAAQPTEWDALFAAIRDELNDIETIAAKMKAEG